MSRRRVGPARCGSTDPLHVQRQCPRCNAAYMREYRARGRSPDLVRCAICKLVRRPRSIPVFQYALARHVRIAGRHTTRVIASIGICDRCVRELARPSPSYSKAHGLPLGQWAPLTSPRDTPASSERTDPPHRP